MAAKISSLLQQTFAVSQGVNSLVVVATYLRRQSLALPLLVDLLLNGANGGIDGGQVSL